MLRRIGFLSLIVAGFFSIPGPCLAVYTECMNGFCGDVDAEINEPVFGYSYFPAQASFEKLPSDNLGTCLNLARKNFFDGGKVLPWLYLYGDYRKGDTRLIIVGDKIGTAIFVQRGQSCADWGVVLAFLQLGRGTPDDPHVPPYLTQQEMEGVFADLLRRYAAAFGSKAKFYAWLDPLTQSGIDQCKGMPHAYCHPTWHDLPQDLQAMLASFRQDGTK